MKPKVPRPNKIEDYLSAKNETIASTAKVLIEAERGLSFVEIAQRISPDKSKNAVADALRMMRFHNLVYLSGWVKSPRNGLVAEFKRGNLPDAEKPKDSKSNYYYVKNIKKVTAEKVEEELNLDHCLALQRALVPKRNERQQREVNQRYWDHLQGIRG
jgi:hypothetical protein